MLGAGEAETCPVDLPLHAYGVLRPRAPGDADAGTDALDVPAAPADAAALASTALMRRLRAEHGCAHLCIWSWLPPSSKL